MYSSEKENNVRSFLFVLITISPFIIKTFKETSTFKGIIQNHNQKVVHCHISEISTEYKGLYLLFDNYKLLLSYRNKIRWTNALIVIWNLIHRIE